MLELESPVPLCDPSGSGSLNPAAVGWSRRPLHTCNLSGAWPRKKRWNYWAFTTETHLFSVTVSNIDYVGLAFVYVADFERGTFAEETVLAPFGRGCDLPDTVYESVHFERGGLRIAMRYSGASGPSPTVRIQVDMPRFGGRGLHADLEATVPAGHDTLNVVIPWSDRRFQFTAKHNTLPAQGIVRLGARNGEAEEIRFEGPQSFACLDYGRGVWPYRCAWNWGAASGRQGERTVGLNLGGKWTDGTGATENAVCIDGTLVKIDEDLAWSYEPSDWMKPWQIRTPGSDAVDLEFAPRLERVAAVNAWVVRSEVHQLFGGYRGRVRDAEGRPVEIDGLVGWAEEHRAAW